MKKYLLNIAATLSLFLLLGVAAAGQTTRQMTIEVPFDFYVGKTVLPAGNYTVYRMSTNSGNGFLLRDANGQSKVVFNAQQALSAGASEENKLEFRSYNNKYFLAGFRIAGNNIGYELQTTRLERELALEATQKGIKPDVVTATTP